MLQTFQNFNLKITIAIFIWPSIYEIGLRAGEGAKLRSFERMGRCWTALLCCQVGALNSVITFIRREIFTLLFWL